jgi:hypothetical protein
LYANDVHQQMRKVWLACRLAALRSTYAAAQKPGSHGAHALQDTPMLEAISHILKSESGEAFEAALPMLEVVLVPVASAASRASFFTRHQGAIVLSRLLKDASVATEITRIAAAKVIRLTGVIRSTTAPISVNSIDSAKPIHYHNSHTPFCISEQRC